MGPGTGASCVIVTLRAKFSIRIWVDSRDYLRFQRAALQSTSATALVRNAIRSAFGMGVKKIKGRGARGDVDTESKQKTKNDDGAQRMAQFKWLMAHRWDHHDKREFPG